MLRRRQQNAFRFTPESDPRYCASTLNHTARRKPTHIITLGKQSFRVCASCARPYEGMRNAKVDRIGKEVAHG